MAREGLMDDSGYKITECESDKPCGHCGNKNCVWYDDFLDDEDDDDEG